MKKYYKKAYKHRFDVYLTIQLLLLFGVLIFPNRIYENTITPILLSLNILAGIVIVSKKRKLLWFSLALFVISLFFFGAEILFKSNEVNHYLLPRLGIYAIFTVLVTFEIIKQIWKEKEVDKKVILGLVSGYISLGFLGYFLFIAINIEYKDAFAGALLNTTDLATYSDSLLYYSFVTLLTIGYGEIVPAIPIAQKAAILVGLVGQFYIAIITAVVIEKYIRHSVKLKQ